MKIAEEQMEKIVETFAPCKSVKVEENEGDICLKIHRNYGQNNATMAQIRYLENIDNYIGTISHSKLLKVHIRVMSTIIDTLLKNNNVNFYISI